MKKILIVEDEDFTRQHLARLIEKRGFSVSAAALGQEAISVYGDIHPDCVFLDLRLPDISGLEVLSKIKAIEPTANVYIVSGSENAEYKADSLSLGAAGYLVKPVDIGAVIEILESLDK